MSNLVDIFKIYASFMKLSVANVLVEDPKKQPKVVRNMVYKLVSSDRGTG